MSEAQITPTRPTSMFIIIIDLDDRSIDLGPQQGFVVPKGVTHRTRAPERAVVLMDETATIVPTGDA